MSEPSIRLIQEVVCEHYGIAHGELLSLRRGPSAARMVAVHLACRLTSRSLSAIGRVMARDHSSIQYADRKITALAATDPDLATELAVLSVAAIATATALDGARMAAADHDAVALAETVLASRRGATSLSVDEIRALAAAVLAGRDAETTTSNEEIAHG